MEISLRPISHSDDEIATGHCIFYPANEVDAVACTFNMGGFSPMKAVLRAHGVDEAHFHAIRRNHEDGKFRSITHGEGFPNIITSTRTATWNEFPGASVQILMAVEDHFCKSLCMTHFAYIFGKFPVEAFRNCMRAVNVAWTFSKLQKIVVDVDDRFYADATQIWQQVRSEPSHGH